jgi:hypothetical protein
MVIAMNRIGFVQSLIASFSVFALSVGGCGGQAVIDPEGHDSGGSNGGSSFGLTGGTPSFGGQGGDGGNGVGFGGRPPLDPCSESALGGPCDAAFPICRTETISGIPCCMISKVCQNGVVAWPVSCFDNCAQNCELVTNPVHCGVMPWCAWTGDDGCIPVEG